MDQDNQEIREELRKEKEMEKIVNHSHELKIPYKTKKAIGIPYDSLLIIGEK